MARPMPTLEEVRQVALKHLLPYGVEKVAIFGSFARGEAGDESDIDLLVSFAYPTKLRLGLYEFMDLRDAMARELGRRVDLVSPKYMRPNKRRVFEEDSIVIYEAA